MKGRRFVWIFVVLFLLLVFPLIWLEGPAIGLPVALVVAVGGGFFLKSRLYALSRMQVGKFYYPISQSLVNLEAMVVEARAAADEALKQERLRVAGVRDEAMSKAKQKQSKTIADGEANRDERLRQINEVFARKKVETQTRLAREMREAVDAHDKRMAELPVQHEASVRKLEEKYQALKEKIRAHHETGWNSLATRWHEGMAGVQAAARRGPSRGRRLRPALGRPLVGRPPLSQRRPADAPDRRDPGRPRNPPRRRPGRPSAEGRDRRPASPSPRSCPSPIARTS